jgi:hypothetical protein
LPLIDQGAQVIFVFEPWNVVVWLRRKIGAPNPAFGQRTENRKPAAAHQAMHKRCDEDGLAGARQSGDAEPHRRIQQAFAKFQQCTAGEPRLFEYLREPVAHQSGTAVI